jgi:cyclopropane fatty-acyl-phospholipid synthase-like methyltransferase
VAGYDAKAATDFDAEVAKLRELGLGAGDTLVDLGCGTGGLVAAAAPHCARVVAVDVSPVMLEAAAVKVREMPNVELVQAGFLTYEHEGEAPGFVYSRNALHHLPDFWKAVALRRIAAMLRRDGFVVLRDVVFSFDPSDADERINSWLAQASDDPAEGWTRPELEEHVRDEYSTFAWLLEPMIERAGLEIIEVESGESGIFSLYVLSSRV